MIILRNPGEIEIDFLRVMGTTVKESDNPIGRFGTGLKYAIAVFLREGIEPVLWIGENRYTFAVDSRELRGKRFDFCRMVGKYDTVELPFTTEYGGDWELWQAYREIRSNTIDEGGEEIRDNVVPAQAGFTMFCLPTMETTGVFLADAAPKLLYSDTSLEIYEGPSNVMYYRGIRAKDLKSQSYFTYNIKRECDLSEDRTLCYDSEISRTIAEAVVSMGNGAIIKQVIAAEPDSFEVSLDIRTYNYAKPSETFLETYKSSDKITNSSAREYYIAQQPKKPRTKSEKKTTFMFDLLKLCSGYGLDADEDDGKLVITGELLENESDEQNDED